MADNQIQVHVPAGALKEPDNRDYTNRFKIRSATSAALYLIAQHRASGHWCCSCPGWIRHRYCKHLRGVGVPEALSHQREQKQIK